MKNNMTVGKRIALGFTAVIVIAVLLGGLGVWKMMAAKTDSTKLAYEYVPEVKVANDLRAAANRVMYEMRGYGLSEADEYYQAAQKEMTEVTKHLKDASELADRAVNLKALKGQVAKANSAVKEYASLMKQTEEAITAMNVQRAQLDKNAASYMQNCAEFLAHQNEAFAHDLEDRQQKVLLATAIADRGTRVRVSNFKAQATSDMALMQNAIDDLKGLDKELGALRPITRQEANIKQIDTIAEAAKKYAVDMDAYVRITGNLGKACEQMNRNAAAYMQNCSAFLDDQNKAMQSEIGQEGANLKERLDKINLANDVIDLGNEVRVMNFRAQATCDVATMEAAIAKLQSLGTLTAALRKITHEDANIKQIEKVEAAGEAYGKAMKDCVTAYGDLSKIRTEMDGIAGEYVANCQSFLESQQAQLEKDMRERHLKITLANDVVDLGNDARIKAFRAQALQTPSIIQDAMANFKQLEEKYAALRKITRLDADLKRIDQTETAGRNYAAALTAFLANWQKVDAIAGQRAQAGRTVIEACQATADAGMTNTDEIARESARSLAASSAIMIVGLLIGVAIATAAAMLITRRISGALTVIINGLNSGAEQVSSASGQVSSASQQLAEGASEQASSLEETSSSLEEMASMTRQNADNANQANSLMSEAKKTVDESMQAMERMTGEINKIRESANQTAKIIKTIDEIAFQTNLLALNAAVEAARAGEAGKGFAVVAEEVRNLARRSAEAAKNTADLIEGSQKNAESGVTVTAELAKSLQATAENASKVGTLVAEIAAASKEQSQGIDQVNTAVAEMDKVVQSNAANAEESASASEELSSQAEELNGMVAELMAMVGGADGNGNGNGNGHHKKLVASGQSKQLAVHKIAPTHTGQPPARLSAAGKKAASARKLEAVGAAKAVKPEEVIPLDESDFKDF